MEHVFSNVLQFLIGGRSRPCPDIHAFFHHLRRHALLAELEKTSYGKRIVLDAAYATPKATGALFDLRGQCLDAMCRQVLRDKKRNYVFRTRHVFGAPKTSTRTIGIVLYNDCFYLVSLRDGEITGCLTSSHPTRG